MSAKIIDNNGVATTVCLGYCISLCKEAVVESLRRDDPQMAEIMKDKLEDTDEGVWEYAKEYFGDVSSFNAANGANLEQFSHLGQILVFDDPIVIRGDDAGGSHVPWGMVDLSKLPRLNEAVRKRLGDYLSFCCVAHAAVEPKLTLITY